MRWLSNLQGTLGLRYGFDDDYASSAFFGGEVGGQAGKIHDSCRQDSELRKRTGFRSVIGRFHTPYGGDYKGRQVITEI